MRAAIVCAASHSISLGTISAAAWEFGFEMMPAVLMVGIEQELLIPFRAGDGALDHGGLETGFAHGLLHPPAGRLVELGIAHDSALAHLTLAYLKLRFDQYNHLPAGPYQRHDCRQNQRDRNEAHVAHRQIHRLADFVHGQLARVDAFMEHYARVRAELPVELPRAYIHRVDAGRAALQEYVREAAGGGADVETDPSRHFDGEVPHGAGELQPAPAHVGWFREHFQRAIGLHHLSRLGRFLAVGANLARHDERLGLFTGFGETALHHQTVQPGLHDLRWTMRSASPCSASHE